MDWVILVVAGVFEVVWATSLKFSDGFTKLIPSVITIIGTVISFLLLAKAIKTLPMGTAYAVWTGIGAVGSVIVGILIFKEPFTLLRILFMSLIIAGIIGLKATAT